MHREAAAKKRKTRTTGRPVWEGCRTGRVTQRGLTTDIETDVLIVGAGITGAMIANVVRAAGFDVAIVDKRDRIAARLSESARARCGPQRFPAIAA